MVRYGLLGRGVNYLRMVCLFHDGKNSSVCTMFLHPHFIFKEYYWDYGFQCDLFGRSGRCGLVWYPLALCISFGNQTLQWKIQNSWLIRFSKQPFSHIADKAASSIWIQHTAAGWLIAALPDVELHYNYLVLNMPLSPKTFFWRICHLNSCFTLFFLKFLALLWVWLKIGYPFLMHGSC